MLLRLLLAALTFGLVMSVCGSFADAYEIPRTYCLLLGPLAWMLAENIASRWMPATPSEDKKDE